jgi:hypothetical protein
MVLGTSEAAYFDGVKVIDPPNPIGTTDGGALANLHLAKRLLWSDNPVNFLRINQ